MSILLISKEPVYHLDQKKIALTNTSATSQVLVRIILREKYGINPRYFESPPDLPQMFREADAALLIGDDALRAFANPGRFYLYDLGEEWKGLTGEKMVYAVWCARKKYADEHIEKVRAVFHAFQRSMEMSKKEMDTISASAARWDAFTKDFLKGYFTTLKFEFGKDYQRGFIAYLEKARQLGAIAKVPELDFVEMS